MLPIHLTTCLVTHRTPLIAAVASNLVNLGLDCFLMFVLGWGVAGAALATSASQYASFAVMYYLMLKKGILQQQDMRTVPGLAQVMPILKVCNASLSALCCALGCFAGMLNQPHVCL